MDSGNTYYYRPCNIISNPQCQSDNPPDDSPAVCQKDSRKVPQFHDLGSLTHPSWSARSSGPETGFVLLFSGGSEDRTADIEFICNTNAGIGTFATKQPTEQPQHQYHFKWESAYACPVNGSSNGTVCCSYTSNARQSSSFRKAPRDTRHTCATGDQQCPFNMGTFTYTGNVTVPSCDQCGSPQRNCCFYVDPNNTSTVLPMCMTSIACPPFYSFNGSNLKFVGFTQVDDCSDCYFA